MLIVTEEDWQEVIQKLSPVHSVKLKIDGYDVTLALERTGTTDYRIFVYVGGEFWRIVKLDGDLCGKELNMYSQQI
jgi:hypothetical protein